MKTIDYIIILLVLFCFIAAVKFLKNQSNKGGCMGCSSNKAGCSGCKSYNSNTRSIKGGK